MSQKATTQKRCELTKLHQGEHETHSKVRETTHQGKRKKDMPLKKKSFNIGVGRRSTKKPSGWDAGKNDLGVGEFGPRRNKLPRGYPSMGVSRKDQGSRNKGGATAKQGASKTRPKKRPGPRCKRSKLGKKKKGTQWGWGDPKTTQNNTPSQREPGREGKIVWKGTPNTL